MSPWPADWPRRAEGQRQEGTTALKIAVTLWGAFMVMDCGLVLPLRSPLQPLN